MKSRRQNWNSQQLNLEEWQKLYYLNQQSYLRTRLIAIKLLFEGKSRTEVSQSVDCTYKTLTSWIDKYLEAGLFKLTESIKHQAPQRLNWSQKQQIKQMLLEQTPIDYGIDRNLWTAKIIIQIIEQKWNVKLSDSRIYQIIQELNLSYQRSHRDYANADKYLSKINYILVAKVVKHFFQISN